ncbi:MAG: glycosyltransferase family 4 protein [bacterium]|nr:glycosyltransferase family 4 protein [bacterium]
MNLLFVANVSRDLYNFRMGLMRTLKEKGFEIICIAPKDNFSEKFLEEGFKYISVEDLKREEKSPFKNLLLVWELYKIYKKENPTLVFHYTIKPNIFGNIAVKLARVKSFSIITGLGSFFVRKSIIQILIRCLYKISLSFSEKAFFLNKEDRDFFIKNKIVSPNKAILLNSEGVNTGFFSPEFCGKVPKDSDKLVFLLIARLLWDKGIGEFIESARRVKAKYPSTEFWLLGPIDKANPTAIPIEVIKGWEGEGIIKYLGVTDDVRPFICQSDVVVLPSYREGVPRSLLEAISMGKPIITTDTVGCREVVEDNKNGFLVKVKDVESLINAMIRFIELSEEERRQMGGYSRKKAIEEFDEKLIINRYLEIIREVLGEKALPI